MICHHEISTRGGFILSNYKKTYQINTVEM